MQEGEKSSFVLYAEYFKHIKKLSMEQRGELLTAILSYASGEEQPELDAVTDMIFGIIKERMDRDFTAYMDKVEKRRNAGTLGGRPKKANDTHEKQEETEKANGIYEKHEKTKEPNGFLEKQEKAKKANGFSEKQKNPDTDNVPVLVPVNNKKLFAPGDESPCAGKLILNDGSEYIITENDVVTYQQLYRGIDVREELRKMEAWCLANEKNRKTRGGAKRFFNNWLSRAQDRARAKEIPTEPPKPPKKNAFNNFSQREYDYDALETMLLQADAGG